MKHYIHSAKVIKNGKRKAENGKLLFFGFRLEWENGTDERSNGERLLAGSLLQGGGKALEEGLKRKTFNLVRSEEIVDRSEEIVVKNFQRPL